MGLLIPWPIDAKQSEPKVSLAATPAEYLFNLWRDARCRQGWEEFKWHNLSETQQFVWKLVAAQLWQAQEK